MATSYDEEMAALRVFADPTLRPDEKQARLSSMFGGPLAGPAPDMRVAGPGGGDTAEASAAGWASVDPTIAASNEALQADAEAQSAPPPGPPTPDVPHGILAGRATPRPAKPPTPADGGPATQGVSLEDGPAFDDDAPGVSAEEYRAAGSRAALLLAQPTGRAPRPQESVQESTQVVEGSIDPEALEEMRQTQLQAVDAEVRAEEMRMQQEIAAREAQIAGLEAAESERARMAQIRDRALQEADRIKAQHDAISAEISNADPAEEGLFVGKNFGESLVSALGLMFMGIGMGGSGNADKIVPTVKQMALREVDRQKRWSELQGQKLDALGSAYDRHMQVLKDHELASQATLTDIVKMSELQALKLARDTTEPRLKAELEAKAAALSAAAQAEYAKLAHQFGAKVQSSVQLAYQQDRGTRAKQQAAMAAQAQAAATPPTPESEEEHFQRLAGKSDPAAVDKDVREATGIPEPKPAAKPAPSKGAAQPAQAPRGDAEAERQSRVLTLHAQGRTDEAVAALKPTERQYLAQLFRQAKSDLGQGATDADAMDLAMKRFGARSPVEIIPQAHRDRVVRVDGKALFANDKTAAALAQKQVSDADTAIGLARTMAQLAERYKGSGFKDAASRGRIEAVGSRLMAILSKTDEQGVIREGGDEKRYENRAGMAVKNFLVDPTTDPSAAVRETLRMLQAGKRIVVSTLSSSWTGDEPARREIREVR